MKEKSSSKKSSCLLTFLYAIPDVGGKFKSATSVILGYLIFLCFSPIASSAAVFNTATTDQRPPVNDREFEGQEGEVDFRSGNLTIQQKDLALPGNGGLNIEVWRTYDMQSSSAGLLSTYNMSYKWTALGPGWSLGVAPRIRFRYNEITRQQTPEDPAETSTSDSLLLRICRGSDVTSWNGGSENPVLELPNGQQELLYAAGEKKAYSKGGWKLDCIGGTIKTTSPDGTIYNFGNVDRDRYYGNFIIADTDVLLVSNQSIYQAPNRAEGYLVAKSAQDVNGNTLTYEYRPAATTPYAVPGKRFPGIGSSTLYDFDRGDVKINSVVASDGRRINFQYDPVTQKLLSITDGSRIWSYEYLNQDANNSTVLNRVLLPSGESWSFSYAPGPFLTIKSRVDTYSPLNQSTIISRKLTAVTNPRGGITRYSYGWVTDRITMYAPGQTYSAKVYRERINGKTQSSGAEWKYGYALGSIGKYDTTTVAGPEGTTTYSFMSHSYVVANQGVNYQSQNVGWTIGQLFKVDFPLGKSQDFGYIPRVLVPLKTSVVGLGIVYDDNVWSADLAQKTTIIDGASYVTSYSNYDVYGNPGTRVETGPNGGSRTTTYTYFNDPARWILGKIASETSPGKSLTRTFDANGNVLTETREGVIVSFTYDTQGNIASKTLPGGRVYTYSNYKRGIAQTETLPENITITRVVDDAGNISAHTNGEGKTTLYTYDGINRLTSVIPPVCNPRSIAYTPISKTSTRGPLVETTQYDNFGRTTGITLAGITRTFSYDGLGRKTFESNPGETVGTSYLYDALNRLTRQTNADGTFQTYSYGPATASVTDERGNLTTYTYRSYGDPDQQLLMAITTPENSVNVTIERGANDLMTSVTQAGLTRTYGYDAHNYLISVSNPETGVTTYGRDIAGNLTSKQVGASGTTRYTYDELNRLTSTVYPDATPAITNTYNKNSKLLSSNSAGGNRSFTYDAADNLVQDSLALDGRVFTTRFAYNGNDNLSSITYPESSRMVNYVPDVLGRPTSISGYISAVQYWPSGLIQSITYNNGIVSRYGQNSRLWPASFITETPFTATHLSSNYTYDGTGNLKTVSDDVDASFNRTLDYDGINRLTGVAGLWGQGSIAYDGGGNLINQTLGQASLTYAYDANNRLSSVSGFRTDSYGYDAYGNVSSSQDSTYTYNDVPNLVCINCASPAAKVEYSYDGLNHRSAVVKASGKVYEIYDSNGKQLIELDGGTLTEYFYLGDKRVAQQVSP